MINRYTRIPATPLTKQLIFCSVLFFSGHQIITKQNYKKRKFQNETTEVSTLHKQKNPRNIQMEKCQLSMPAQRGEDCLYIKSWEEVP